MVVRMVRVEAYQHLAVALGDFANLGQDFFLNARTLDHLDARCQGMRLDCRPVVRPDIDVDTKHLAARLCGGNTGFRIAYVKQGQHGSTEYQRTAVRNAGLDNQVGLHFPDDLLHRHHVLRILDHRATQPTVVVGILGRNGRPHEGRRTCAQGFISRICGNSCCNFLIEFSHGRRSHSGRHCWTSALSLPGSLNSLHRSSILPAALPGLVPARRPASRWREGTFPAWRD